MATDNLNGVLWRELTDTPRSLYRSYTPMNTTCLFSRRIPCTYLQYTCKATVWYKERQFLTTSQYIMYTCVCVCVCAVLLNIERHVRVTNDARFIINKKYKFVIYYINLFIRILETVSIDTWWGPLPQLFVEEHTTSWRFLTKKLLKTTTTKADIR